MKARKVQKSDPEIRRAKFSRMLKIKKALQEHPMSFNEIVSLFTEKISERTLYFYLEELIALEIIWLNVTTHRYRYLAIPDDLSHQELKLMLNHSHRLLKENKELNDARNSLGDVTSEALLWQLVTHEATFGEIHRLKQHLKTGYYDNIWIPLMEYRSLMKRHDFPTITPSAKFIRITEGAETNVDSGIFESSVPADVERKLLDLNKSLLVSLYELMIDVSHQIPLKGYCEHCPARLIRIRSENQWVT